jgi:hypothetical protein
MFNFPTTWTFVHHKFLLLIHILYAKFRLSYTAVEQVSHPIVALSAKPTFHKPSCSFDKWVDLGCQHWRCAWINCILFRADVIQIVVFSYLLSKTEKYKMLRTGRSLDRKTEEVVLRRILGPKGEKQRLMLLFIHTSYQILLGWWNTILIQILGGCLWFLSYLYCLFCM